MLLARLPSGRRVYLDATRLEPEVGALGYNPRRQTARELEPTDVPHPAWKWAYAGATFHNLHRDVCPGSRVPQRRARYRTGQVGLGL